MKKILIILMLSILIITGCTKDTPAAKLRIGVMSDVGATPFIVAQDKGYFKDLGLDIEISVFKSAIDRDTALQTGNLDGVMADMLTIIFYNDSELNAQMTSQTYGNYKMVTSPTLDIQSLTNLENITVGISSNTVIEFATDQVAKANQIENKLVKTAIPQMPVRLEMLKSGELNAATLPEPLATAATLDGGVTVLGTEDLALQPGVFIFTTDTLDNKSNEIESMYTAYNKAVDYINSNAEGDFMSLLIEKLGFPPVLEGKFEFPTLNHAQPADEKTFNVVNSWMIAKELTIKLYNYSDVSTSKFIK